MSSAEIAQMQMELNVFGEIVSNLINTHGMDSPEFKAADAKYSDMVNARDVAVAANLKAADAAFCVEVREAYGPNYDNIPHGQEESTFYALGAIAGRIIQTHGVDSPEFKEAEALYARIVPAWTAFKNAAALAAK